MRYGQLTKTSRAAFWLNAAADSRRFAERCHGYARSCELARCAAYIDTARSILRGRGEYYRNAFA